METSNEFDSGEKKIIKLKVLEKCGGCRKSTLTVIYDFGLVPLAGYFPKNKNEIFPDIPMELLYCEPCKLYQISPDLEDGFLFHNYRYVSSIGMQEHFDKFATWFVANFNPSPMSKILEIGCNDGPFLKALTKLGFAPIGIDPATNIVKLAVQKGLNVINDFFGPKALVDYNELQQLDYIFTSNSFAHISDIGTIAESISKALAPNGKVIIEVQNFHKLIKTSAIDFIYHEHKYYYTIESISNLLEANGLYLNKCHETDSHGGSYRFVFSKNKSVFDFETKFLIEHELNSPITPEQIINSIIRYRTQLIKVDRFLSKEFQKGRSIVAFGASGRGNMLLSNLIDSKRAIDFVIDESPERIGRQMANHLIPIKDFNEVDYDDIDIILILAWNFSSHIINKWPSKEAIFVKPLPQYRLVKPNINKN